MPARILQSDVRTFVKDTLLNIRLGLEDAIAQGLIVELPEKVDFQLEIVSNDQSMILVTSHSEIEPAKSETTSEGASTDTSTRAGSVDTTAEAAATDRSTRAESVDTTAEAAATDRSTRAESFDTTEEAPATDITTEGAAIDTETDSRTATQGTVDGGGDSTTLTKSYDEFTYTESGA